MEIVLDTAAEVDCVSVEWAKQAELKPYTKRYPELLAVAGNRSAQAKGAYWVWYTIVNPLGTVKEFHRPFLTID